MKLHSMMGGIPHSTIIGTAHFLFTLHPREQCNHRLLHRFPFSAFQARISLHERVDILLSPATMAPNFYDHNDTISG
jgi:hypothetical protein